jgi:hypothetical protein
MASLRDRVCVCRGVGRPPGIRRLIFPRRIALPIRQLLHRCAFVVAALLSVAHAAVAGPASDVLLPAATKGYLSVAKAEEAEERFKQTQFGQLLDDEVMDAFVKSLEKQVHDKLGDVTNRLGFTYDDLQGVTAGELSFAIIEQPGQEASLAITMDVTGRDAAAKAFLQAVAKRFAGMGGEKRDMQSAGTTLTIFDVPPRRSTDKAIQTVYFIRDNVLVGINGRDQAEAMLKRFAGTPTDNLASVAAYQNTMARCKADAKGVEPEVRWFAEPFPLLWATRTLTTTKTLRPDKDIAKILEQQGFDAIRGVGGQANMLAPGGIDFLYRMAVYAPPINANDPLRWDKAMRMLQTPNSTQMTPQSWVPRQCARYATYNIDLLNAFDHFASLFDALEGHKDAFKTSMDGLEKDPWGPQINIRDELIAHMGQRVTLVADYATPISVKSERSVIAIEAKDEAKLADTIRRIMEKEPDVERRDVGNFVIWERVPEKMEVEELSFEAPSLSPLDEPAAAPADGEGEEHVMPNSAVCVAMGQMFMGSDIKYLEELLAGFGQRELLTSSVDYQQVEGLMNGMAPAERCGWSFVRTDEAFRPEYELIRQGRMPESQTMLGKFLNRMLTTEVEKEEGILRKQKLDGSDLPSFEMVRRYFGPAGRVLHADKDGWLLTGALLNKEAPSQVAER